MHILQITGRADVGGGPQHLLGVLEELKGRMAMHVACPQTQPYWDIYAGQVGNENLFELPSRQFSLRHLYELGTFCENKEIALIHTHGRAAGLFGRLVGRIKNIPVVHTFHGIQTKGLCKIIEYHVTERLLAHITRRLIFVSESERKIGRFLPAWKGQGSVILNGVDIPEASILQEPTIPLRVICASRFIPQKNTSFILEIARRVFAQAGNTIQFEIFGDGPERDAFEQMRNDLGLSQVVHTRGNVYGLENKIAGALAALSTSLWEGLPLFLLESLARGIPVVATCVAGNVDVVDHGCEGFLFDVGAADVAAEHLLKLSEDRRLWREMSRAARRSAMERFSRRSMAENLERIYNDAIR